MANQTLGHIFAGLGNFAGGLSQGIETGVALTQRQQEMELRKRQANLQSIDAISQVMKPGVDPTIREFTLANVLPQLGLKPEEGKQMMKLMNGIDDEARATFVEFINNNPDIAMGKTPPKVLLQQLMQNPIEGFKFINDWVADRKAQKIDEEGLQLQKSKFDLDVTQTEHSMRQDEARTAISAEGLELERGRLELAAKQAEEAILDKMIDNRRQAVTALTNAASIKDPKVRGVVAKRLSDEFGLGLTDQDIIAFESDAAGSLETLLDKAKLEETLLDIDQKKSGANLPTSTRKMYLSVRSRGETTDAMPDGIKEMTPEQAKDALTDLSTSKMTVMKGSLENKGSRDKARVDISDIEVAQELNTRLIDIIEKNPEAAGLLGSTARLGQRLSGALTSFEPLVSGAREEIAELIATADPATKTAVARVLSNRNVSIAEVLETAVRLRYARTLSDSARINKDQYDVAADQVKITGFRGQENVVEKLKAVNDVLQTFKSGKQQLLDEGKIGIMSEEDAQDDEDYGGFIDELTDEEE